MPGHAVVRRRRDSKHRFDRCYEAGVYVVVGPTPGSSPAFAEFSDLGSAEWRATAGRQPTLTGFEKKNAGAAYRVGPETWSMKGVASAGPRGKRSRLQRDFTCSTVARVARALRTQVAAQVLPPRARRARALERGLPARRHLPDRRQAVAHPAGPRVARGGARRDRGGARARGAGRRRRARPGARARAAARRRRARAGRAERRRRARPGAAAQERARPLSRGARRSDDSLVSIPRSDPSRSRPPASRTTSLAPRSTSFDAPLDVVRAAMLSNENLICVIRRETSADSSSERGGRARAGKLGAGSSCNKRSFRGEPRRIHPAVA